MSCKNKSPYKVKIGDYYQYPINGMGELVYKLDSRKSMKIKEVLYVPGSKKNILSILDLDKKGFRVDIVDGEVLMWPKGKPIYDAVLIGVEEGGLYKLKGHTYSILTTISINLCALWHKRLAYVNCKTLPIVRKVVTCIPGIQINHEVFCIGSVQEKNTKQQQ